MKAWLLETGDGFEFCKGEGLQKMGTNLVPGGLMAPC